MPNTSVTPDPKWFVWTKMHAEGGSSLPEIMALKETERLAGNGVFWWGIGTKLKLSTVQEKARAAGGTLPVLFSLMISRPKPEDENPESVFLWRDWKDAEGIVRNIPKHILEWSRGSPGKKVHYALVCYSAAPLAVVDHGPFNPELCPQVGGKSPGNIQVTSLLKTSMGDDHSSGPYHFGFRATLVEPWFVELVNPRQLNSKERRLFEGWKGEWLQFASRLKKRKAN